MGFSLTEKVNILFHKLIGGKSFTNQNLSFDEEQFDSPYNTLFKYIWVDDIPDNNPLANHTTYGDGSLHPTSDPIIKKWHKVKMTPVTTAKDNKSFRYGNNLKDIIPSEYGEGNYQWEVWKKDITGSYAVKIPFGMNSWYFDRDAGILTFFGDLPKGVDNGDNPPAITVYQYVGRKGKQSLLSSDGSATNVDDVTVEIDNDDKITIKNKYKTASYFAENLSGTPTETKGIYTITHNLASKKVDVTVYEKANDEMVIVPWVIKNNSQVELSFAPDVQSNQYSVRVEASY